VSYNFYRYILTFKESLLTTCRSHTLRLFSVISSDKQVTENENAVAHDRCHIWYYKDSKGIDVGEFNILK
jgi:hypothetical protein